MDLRRTTDEQLLHAPPAGSEGQAFEAFYRRHERLIAAYHLRRAPNPEIAADLTAETFARALEGRRRFAPRGDGSAVRWLYGIAANVRADGARRAGAELRMVQELGIVRRGLRDEQREELHVLATPEGALAALATLPEEQREAIHARIFDEVSYPEAAARAGLPEATIRKRVSRGIAALRRAAKEPA